MKKLLIAVGCVLLVGLSGCSLSSTGEDAGILAVFHGTPLIFDPAVVHQGTVIGQMRSSEWRNGVTRVTIDLDDPFTPLLLSNAVVVVKGGRLHWKQVSGYGEPLSAGACINGFRNIVSYQLFRAKHLMNNILISASRRAMQLQARSEMKS